MYIYIYLYTRTAGNKLSFRLFDEELVVSRKSGRCAYIENTSNTIIPCSINIWWTEQSFSCAESFGSFYSITCAATMYLYMIFRPCCLALTLLDKRLTRPTKSSHIKVLSATGLITQVVSALYCCNAVCTMCASRWITGFSDHKQSPFACAFSANFTYAFKNPHPDCISCQPSDSVSQ